MDAFLVSFGIIFLAELGDKSQLMAMAFAARYPAKTILIAITAATALVHLVSVLIGAAFGAALPTDTISVVAGLAFLAFAAWTLRGDELGDQDMVRAEQTSRSVFLTVGVAFFLAELGDKTMLATITLATDNGLAVGTSIDQPSAWSLPTTRHRRRPATRRSTSRTCRQDRGLSDVRNFRPFIAEGLR